MFSRVLRFLLVICTYSHTLHKYKLLLLLLAVTKCKLIMSFDSMMLQLLLYLPLEISDSYMYLGNTEAKSHWEYSLFVAANESVFSHFDSHFIAVTIPLGAFSFSSMATTRQLLYRYPCLPFKQQLLHALIRSGFQPTMWDIKCA